MLKDESDDPQLPIKIRAQDLVNCIPIRQPLSIKAKPIYLIIGKSGAGNTSLAREIANTVNAPLIEPIGLIENALSTPDSVFHDQVSSALLLPPGLVPSSLVLDLIKAATSSKHCLSRGFVLDCLAFSGDVQEQVQELYTELLKDTQYNFPVVVSIDISDADLLKRKLGQRVDYSSMRRFGALQIEASMRKQTLVENSEEKDAPADSAEEKETEESDVQLDGDSPHKHSESVPVSSVDEHYDIDLEPGYISDEEAEDLPPLEPENEDGELKDQDVLEQELKDLVKNQRLQRHNACRKLEFTSNVWEPIDDAVLFRLTRESGNVASKVNDDISAYYKVFSVFAAFMKNAKSNHRFLSLDGTQHPSILLKNTLALLQHRGYTVFHRNITPVHLPPPPNTDTTGQKARPAAIEQLEALKYFSKVNLDPQLPRRSIGHFARYCPVTWNNENRLELGLNQFVLSYKHVLYFFASEAKLNEFVEFPELYLSKKPAVNATKIAVIGGPFSGKTTQANLLTEYFNLGYINVTDILLSWDQSPNQKELIKVNPNYAKITKRLKTGKPLTTDMSIDVIKMFLKDPQWVKEHPNGWCLDGFPNTADEAAALIAAGILPDSVCHITNEAKDTSIEKRKELVIADSVSGMLIPAGKQTNAEPASNVAPTENKSSLQELSKSFPVVAYPAYARMLDDSRAEVDEIAKCFEEADVSVFQIQSSQSIISMILHTMYHIHPFVIQPEVLSKDQILPDYIFDSPKKENYSLDLGWAKDYCLYSLKNGNLVKGNRQIAVRYDTETYYFCSEEARRAFLIEPFEYIRNGQLYANAPPHICVIGPSGCGKSAILAKANLAGTPVVAFSDFANILKDCKLDPASRQELELACSSKDSSLTSNSTVNVLTAIQSIEPYKSKGYVLEGFPRTRTEMEACYRSQFHFEVVINVQADSNTSAKRKWNAELLVPNSEIALLVATNNVEEAQVKKEALVEQCDRDSARISDAVAALEKISATPVFTVNADRCERPVLAEVQSILDRHVGANRLSLLETAQPLTPNFLEQGLSEGIWTYSSLSVYDPVSIYTRTANGKYLGAAAHGKLPVLLRNKLYVFANSRLRDKFIETPLKYASSAKLDLQAFVKPQIAITGPPASGKTSLALKIAKDFQLVYVSVAVAVRSILESFEEIQLKDELRSVLRSGSSISDLLAAKSMAFFLKRFDCATRGWVLDGWPEKTEQFQFLEAANFSPQFTLYLKASPDKCRGNALRQVARDSLQHQERAHHPRWVDYRRSAAAPHLESLTNYLESDLNALITLNADVSEWRLNENAQAAICFSLEGRRSFLASLMQNEPASIASSGVRKEVMLSRLGRFKLYCPVALVLEGRLLESEARLSNPLITEYKERFYGFSSLQNRKAFVENPERFIDSEIQLPEFLPRKVERADQELSFGGFCPATYFDNGCRYSSLVRPPSSFKTLVEYRGRFYAPLNDEALQRILQLPERYLGSSTGPALPKRIPPPVEEHLVALLPTEQYLEATVQKQVTEALLALGKVKPKYPYLSISESAEVFLALYLKANDDKLKDYTRAAYEKQLDEFTKACGSLQSLAKQMKRLDGPLQSLLVQNADALPSIGSAFLAKTASTASELQMSAASLSRALGKNKTKLPPITSVEQQKAQIDQQLEGFSQLKNSYFMKRA